MANQFFIRIVLGVLFFLPYTGINAQVKPSTDKTDSIVGKVKESVLPRVLSASSMSAGRSKNSAVYGDYIQVKVDNLDALLKMADSIAPSNIDSSIFLCINDFPSKELTLVDINRAKSTLLFHLDRHSSTLSNLRIYFKNLWGKIEINDITVAVSGQKPLPTDVKKFYLLLTSRQIVIFVVVFLLFILISMAVLVKKTNIIRAGGDGSPFSLAQSQLAFWTLLVSCSIIYVWSVTEEFPKITLSTLGLLGISVATTAGAKMVTYSQKAAIVYKPSNGFFIDILSDDTSVNIHRFQMLLWTMILGVIFIIKVIDQLTIPEFSEDLMILMGISSGTYVLLKNSENKNTTDTVSTGSTAQKAAEGPAADAESPAFG